MMVLSMAADESTRALPLPVDVEKDVLRAYIRRSDKAVFLLDEELQVILVNQFGCNALGKRQEELVGRGFVDELSESGIRDSLGGDLRRVWDRGGGEPLKNTFALVRDDGALTHRLAWQHFGVVESGAGTKLVLSVGEDVEEQLVTAAVLSRRNAILEALSTASERFLLATPEVWERNVIEVLAAMGKARGSDRVYLCKNRTMEDGSVGVSLKYEWKRAGESHVFEGETAQVMGYPAVGLERWAKLLGNREVICEEVESMADEERQWNVAPQAKSFVVIPIHIDEEWWGYWAFEDWDAARQCAPAELDALRALALLFSTAVKRKRMEEELVKEKTSVEAKVAERTRELTVVQNQVQEALVLQKEEKARLTASIHSLSLGFVMTDIQGNVLLFNHAVNDIFGPQNDGWTLEAIQAKLNNVLDVRHLVSECVREVKELVMGDLVYGERFLSIRLTPIKMVEEDGRVIGVVILLGDTTKDKRLQQSRDEFFAVAAHELRTPLTAISGLAKMIMHYYPEVVANNDVAGMLQDIAESSTKLITLVNEYLDVSRAELNKMQVQMEAVNMVEVVTKVVEELTPTAMEKQLTLKLINEHKTLWVQADAARTRQVLMNLVGNAIKYTQRGYVHVKLVRTDINAQVFVVDSGVGIAVEDQQKLFQKFKQLGDRVYDKGVLSGTGMGLYISRLLAEAMGGRVYLEQSVPGQGSTFVLELPWSE